MTKSKLKKLIKQVILENLIPINEGISFSIPGHKHFEDVDSIGRLAQWLEYKVILPLLKEMTLEEKHKIKHDAITADGRDFNKMEGTINVYTGMFPKNWVPYLLGGIQHFLDKREATYGKWEKGISGLHQVEKISIPIVDININTDIPPEVGFSYSNFNRIRKLMDPDSEYSDYCNFDMPVDILIDKVKDIKNKHWLDLDEYDKDRIWRLERLAIWAQKHGYEKISGG
jgi:hypothetical protein